MNQTKPRVGPIWSDRITTTKKDEHRFLSPDRQTPLLATCRMYEQHRGSYAFDFRIVTQTEFRGGVTHQIASLFRLDFDHLTTLSACHGVSTQKLVVRCFPVSWLTCRNPLANIELGSNYRIFSDMMGSSLFVIWRRAFCWIKAASKMTNKVQLLKLVSALHCELPKTRINSNLQRCRVA